MLGGKSFGLQEFSCLHNFFLQSETNLEMGSRLPLGQGEVVV